MANNAKTTVTVTGETKGLAKIRDEAGRVNEAVKRGAESAKQGFRGAKKEVTGFEKAMTGALKAIGKDREGLRAIKALGTEFSNLQKKIEGVEKSFKKAKEAQGAFSQGVAQGLGFGEFLQRGPGMKRQMAGRMIGQAARLPGAGMFGGASALAAGISSLPGGGLVGAPLQQAFSMAGGALAYEQQQLAAMPFLMRQGGASRAMRGKAGAKGMLSSAEIDRQVEAVRMANRPMSELSPKEQYSRGLSNRIEGIGDAPSIAGNLMRMGMNLFAPEEMKKVAKKATSADPVAAKRAQLEGQNAEKLQEARRRMMQKQIFEGIAGSGKAFGFSKAESMQMDLQLSQAGGGPASPQMLKTAMAAQRRFGVGMETSGAFLLAQRQGGLVGGGGARGLSRSLNQAKSMGLEGSEVTAYLSEIAQGIQSFQQTGIPINPRSVSGLARSIAVTGVGIGRGRQIASGVISAGQRMSQTGPSSATDMLMLQAGGYKGGGLDDLLAAQMSLEKGMSGAGAMDVMHKLTKAGGAGAGGVYSLHKGLNRMGVKTSLDEANKLAKNFRGETLSEKERKNVNRIRGRMAAGAADAPGSPNNLQAMAESLTKTLAPHVQKQATMVDAQLAAGQQLLTAVQKLDFASIQTAASVASAMAPTLDWLAGSAQELSTDLRDFVGLIKTKGLAGALAVTLARVDGG